MADESGIALIRAGEPAGPIQPPQYAPVGWLFSMDFTSRATCFLIGDYWIATAGHVFKIRERAADAVVVFNHLRCVEPSKRDAYALCPSGNSFVTRFLDLDFALARICPRAFGLPPGQIWGAIDITRPANPIKGTPIVSVQHPQRQRFKSFSRGAVTDISGHWLIHNARSDGGSSGAPLLDASGAWLGIHKGLWEDKEDVWRATSGVAILAYLRSRGDLHPELRQLVNP
jgi:V8-like Glu-specific endopeptidase